MKKIFIELEVQDGERRHTHRILHTTTGSDIEFAAQRYVAGFWGHGEREGDWWWVGGEIAMRLVRVRELSDFEYQLMSDIFTGNVRQDYFQIVHAGYNTESQREEVQIHCGENGNLYLHQDNDKLGFIVDVYGQCDHVNSMTIWEDELDPKDPDENEEPIFTTQEIDDFIETWGQTHNEICDALGYSRKGSDDLLMVDYFWLPVDKKWLPKSGGLMYTAREHQLADYLRKKS